MTTIQLIFMIPRILDYLLIFIVGFLLGTQKDIRPYITQLLGAFFIFDTAFYLIWLVHGITYLYFVSPPLHLAAFLLLDTLTFTISLNLGQLLRGKYL